MKCYTRKPKAAAEEFMDSTSMEAEEEVELQDSLAPKTPAKPIPVEPCNTTYSRKVPKKNLSGIFGSEVQERASPMSFSAITDSSERNQEGKGQCCSGIRTPSMEIDLNLTLSCGEPSKIFSEEPNNQALEASEITGNFTNGGLDKAFKSGDSVNKGSDEKVSIVDETFTKLSTVAPSTPQRELQESDNQSFILVNYDMPEAVSKCHDQSDGKNKLENVNSHAGTEDGKNHAANLPGDGGSAASMASTKMKLQRNSKKRLNNDIDLNERPKKKPKKKVHRPKVVGEGKPRKPLAPMTPKKAAPKRAPKAEKPKPAAKEHVVRKRKNSSKLKNSVIPSEQSEEKIDPTFVSKLEDESSSIVVTQLEDESASIVVTRHNQEVEGSVNDYGCSYNSLPVYQSKYKTAGDCLISVRKITPMFPNDCMKKRTRKRAEVGKVGLVVLPTRKKRTKMCRRNWALLIAPPVLLNQSASLEEAALASKMLEIEDSHAANKDAFLAEEKEGMLAEKWTEEHKNLPYDNKSSENKEEWIGGSTEVFPSPVTIDFFHISLIRESLTHHGEFEFTFKSSGDDEVKLPQRLSEIGSPLLFSDDGKSEPFPLKHDGLLLNPKSGDTYEGLMANFYKLNQDQNIHEVPHSGCGPIILYQPSKLQYQNTEVLQTSHGAIIPFNGQSALVKKRSKNKFDPVHEKIWKGQLEYILNESEESRQKLEHERAVFHGRIDAFTARMHVILGDRSFSPWKGSVMDSVIGVFLTQNVSDVLSSSAFMSLAARFPIRSESHPDSIIVQHVNLPEYIARECLSQECSTEAINEMGPQNNGTKKEMTDHKQESYIQAATDESISQEQQKGTNSNSEEQQSGKRKATQRMKSKKENEKVKTDWDALKRIYSNGGQRSSFHMDSVDWEAVKNANVGEIAKAIQGRGQHNIIAGRIKELLDRVFELHNCLDLEWLRHAPPEKVKEYLLEFHGLGLKSVECVRLLELQNVSFPVDTNVGRIAVRLGWVPLQPLPEKLQIHLLQQFPIMNSIQKYLWPRLKHLDHQKLYELHYHLITFGKVFCTKTNPSCNSCPMKGECRHYASQYASARLALPGPKRKSKVSPTAPIVAVNHPGSAMNQRSPCFLNGNLFSDSQHGTENVEPIIEMPQSPIIEMPQSPELASPKHEYTEEVDIEDFVRHDPDDIPTIELSVGEVIETLDLRNMMLQDDDVVSRALVPLTGQVASMPVPKLKYVSRLRTTHQVYELPDTHPLLNGFERRDPDDPYPYLLAISMPVSDEAAKSSQPPEESSSCKDFSSSSKSSGEQGLNAIGGTILIPCRTAMRGSFPLNGTYFQVNEVFADFETSNHPIKVPRASIWNLPRKTVFFGTSATAIFRGLSLEEIQQCFWEGFICVRSFDRETRYPKPLSQRFHIRTNEQLGKGKAKENDE
ncbi:hypothetical protein FNV43_RR05549 [Rhamnella rubrinervis]|uniref:Demeter RRM-fold domain-containing protein n=1 Tax=Rhamnella rubrinervis TaxID=2594499 RepID=A0A8K0HLI2_9ROSA|nr:hypothetical protein FNV43_RR05549 [Rhamnella rubrinervis]